MPPSDPSAVEPAPVDRADGLRLVVMGVAGAGKTLLGRGLARRLHGRFVDGDDLHPPANVAKMSAGEPLTDDDRGPWLDLCGRELARAAADGGSLVVACSALRRHYRDRLRQAMPAGEPLWFVHLALDPDTAAARVGERAGHFMPTTLIQSQFATLEPPDPAIEPGVVAVDARLDPATVIGRVLQGLPSPVGRG